MEPLIIQLAAGTLLGLIAQRAGVPALAGFVAAGIFLSLTGFSEPSSLTELSDFGVVLLLFTIGMHINVRDVFRKEVLSTGLAHWIVGGAGFVLLAWLLGMPLVAAIIVAATLGFSSTVLAAQALDRDHEVTAYHGRLAIGILILQDVLAVSLLVILSTEVTHEGVSIFKVLSLALFCLIASVVAMRSHEPILKLMSFVMLAVAFATLFHTIGLSHELGALAAGVLARRIGGYSEIADALWGLKEYFLVGFFLKVGMQASIDFETMLLTLPLLLILPAKAVFFFVLLRATGLRTRTAFLTGSLLTSYSEFALIAAAVALQGGYIDVSWMNAITLAVVAAFVLYIPINRFNHHWYGIFEPVLERLPLQLMVTRFDQIPKHTGGAEIIVVGLGRTGLAALKRAQAIGYTTIGVDADPRNIKELAAQGSQVMVGDALDPHQWASLDLAGVKGVVIALPGAESRLNTAELIRQSGYNGRLVAFAVDDSEAERLRACGVDRVSTLLTDAGERMAEQVLG